MQMLTKAAMGLATNKKVQQMAMNAGYNLGLGAAKRIQARRRRRGRVQLFPTIQAQPRPLVTRTQRDPMPIRVQNTQAAMPASSQANSIGSGLVTQLTWTGSNTVASQVVNPADPDFVTRLSKMAAVYQKYTVRRMVFKYMPAVGTTQDGTVYFLFLPDATMPPPQNADEISQSGGMVSGPVCQPCTIPVATAALNKAFVLQYTGNTTDNIHTIGRLCWAVTGVTSQTSVQMGTIHVDYHVMFSDPKVSYTDQLAGAQNHEMSAADALPLDTPDTVISGVPLFTESAVADVYKRLGKQESALLIVGTTATDTPSIAVTAGEDPSDLNAVGVAHYVSAANKDQIALFELPAGILHVKVDITGGYWADCRLYLFPHRS